MRLRMLDGAAVPPSLFIPVAERTGAIVELGALGAAYGVP
jgi:EAL domain-containing protein (putative c-di-GMP-specific phosphodiesterase class I)